MILSRGTKLRSTMTNPLNKWKSTFGDAYHERNKPTDEALSARAQMWTQILNFICVPGFYPQKILEVGCGTGTNLRVINDLYQAHGVINYELVGVEPNEKARKELRAIEHCKSIGVDAFSIDTKDHYYDLTFTSGVLIHIHPNEQLRAMKEIYRTSNKYIVCAEYFAPELREIRYHGEDGMLWVDDYGSKWLDNFPLRCISYCFHWKRMTGLDNLTWWVMEKVH